MTFLYSGKLVYRKAFDVLLAATEILAARRNDFRLIVMGDGPDRSLLEKTSAAARALMIPAGFKELAQVAQVYAECDALVFPSRYDGWGIAVVEAMAAGMPVIGSRGAASAHDLVRDGESGYLVESGDAKALAAAMGRLLDAPDHVRKMGEAARAAVEPLTATRGAERITGLLREALG